MRVAGKDSPYVCFIVDTYSMSFHIIHTYILWYIKYNTHARGMFAEIEKGIFRLMSFLFI